MDDGYGDEGKENQSEGIDDGGMRTTGFPDSCSVKQQRERGKRERERERKKKSLD